MPSEPRSQPAATAESILALSPAVRYVAILTDTVLLTRQRATLENASAGESDYYEERLVNPTLLDLARRRGEEGCGGFDFLVVGYASFHQLLLPRPRGHASMAIELAANPLDLLPRVREAMSEPVGSFQQPIARPIEVDAPSAAMLLAEPIALWDGTATSEDGRLMAALYAVSADVRYVALKRRGRLGLSSRVGDPAAGDHSDRYEELIVNPGLIALARGRGDIDCGGLRFLAVAYPTFFALVLPLADGHATVSLPRTADPISMLPAFLAARDR